MLVGGGHTHIGVIREADRFVRRGHSVTVVSPAATHLYSGMGPGILAGSWSVPAATLPVRALTVRAGGQFVQGALEHLDLKARRLVLDNTRIVPYDVLSLNLGSEPTAEAQSVAGSDREHVFTTKPIRELARGLAVVERIFRNEGRCSVAVVGSGFSAMEIAANLAWWFRQHDNQADRRPAPPPDHRRSGVTLYTGENPGTRLGGRGAAYVRRVLDRRGVRVDVAAAGAWVDPRVLTEDVLFLATGLRAPAALEQWGLPVAADGSVSINEYLQVSRHPGVFAVGDCAAYLGSPLPRVGVYAVRMTPVLAHNLLVVADRLEAASGRLGAASEASGLRRFTGTGPVLRGMNLGPGAGILFKNRWTLTGPPAWYVKYLIDRRFVRRNQG